MANMNMTVQTPGLEGIFQALAGGGGGGGVNDLISADLNRARRDQIGVQTQLEQARVLAAQKQAQDLARLQTILTDPALASTPEGRASLMSVLAGVPDGLKEGPGFGLGAATFVNPEVFAPGELSQAAFGTGVQPDYSKTPDGTLAGLMNAFDIAKQDNATRIEQTQMEQDGAMQRAQLPPVPGRASTAALPLVNGSVLKTLGEQLDAAFGAQFPGAAVDPSLRQQVLARASEIYQTTRNVQTAVDQALQEARPAEAGGEGWFQGPSINPFDGLFGILPKGGTVQGFPTGPSPMLPPPSAQPAPVAAPAAPAQAAPAGALPPANVPASLRNVQRDPASGGFVLIQNGKAVPLKDGQTAVSPSNPNIRLVFRGGSWFVL